MSVSKSFDFGVEYVRPNSVVIDVSFYYSVFVFYAGVHVREYKAVAYKRRTQRDRTVSRCA